MQVLMGERHALHLPLATAYGIGHRDRLGHPKRRVAFAHPRPIEGAEAWRGEGLGVVLEPSVRSGRWRVGEPVPFAKEPRQLVGRRGLQPYREVLASGVLIGDRRPSERPGIEQPDRPLAHRRRQDGVAK